jgi:hypothetical protein
MKALLAVVLIVALGADPVPAQTAPSAELWRTVAGRIDVGSRVRIVLQNGQRLTATLLDAGPNGLVIQPRTRVPVPSQRVDYGAIAALERDEARGIGAGKAAALGIGTGVAAFLGMLLIFAAAVAD